MHIQIQVDTEDLIARDPARIQAIRAAAYFLLNAIGDLKEEEPPTLTVTATTGTIPDSAKIVGDGVPPGATVHIPPPPSAPIVTFAEAAQSNVVQGNFPHAGAVPPPPPPPPPVNTAVPPAPSSAPPVGDVSGVVSVGVEFDKVGMPWDERIHQKGKNKKKDGTWKLRKGADPALVQAVTVELAARKSAATAGSLPLGGNTVPLPPSAPNAPAASVPPQNRVETPVPVPPPPTAGAVPLPAPGVGNVGTSAYRVFLDRLQDLVKNQKIDPAKVIHICQTHGAPSLQDIKTMEHLIPNIEKDIDAAMLGLL